LCAFRSASGNSILYKRRALPDILRLLASGRSVAILVDQNVQEKDGIFVDFFGRKAAATTVAAALAVRTGCPLATGYAERIEGGRYRMVYEPALDWTPSGNRVEDVARLTQMLAQRIEDWIRRKPEQWLWIHRRWKTQPPPENA